MTRDDLHPIQFRKLYGITHRVVRVRKLRPRYVLLYGRRADALSNPRFSRTRADSLRHDTVEMTYDRLEPSAASASAPVVRMDTSTPSELRFRAITVPPIARAHEFQFIDRSKVIGLEEALAAQTELSEERRAWLLAEAGSHGRLLDDIDRENAEAGEPVDHDEIQYDDDDEGDCY